MNTEHEPAAVTVTVASRPAGDRWIIAARADVPNGDFIVLEGKGPTWVRTSEGVETQIRLALAKIAPDLRPVFRYLDGEAEPDALTNPDHPNCRATFTPKEDTP